MDLLPSPRQRELIALARRPRAGALRAARGAPRSRGLVPVRRLRRPARGRPARPLRPEPLRRAGRRLRDLLPGRRADRAGQRLDRAHLQHALPHHAHDGRARRRHADGARRARAPREAARGEVPRGRRGRRRSTASPTASRSSRDRRTPRSAWADGASAPPRARSTAATWSTAASSSSRWPAARPTSRRRPFAWATSPGSSARSTSRSPRTRRACRSPASGTRWGCAAPSAATWCSRTCSCPTTARCCRPGCFGAMYNAFPHLSPLTFCATFLGLMQAAYDGALAYLTGQMAGSPGLHTEAAVKGHAVAEMLFTLEAARALYYRAISEARVDSPAPSRAARPGRARHRAALGGHGDPGGHPRLRRPRPPEALPARALRARRARGCADAPVDTGDRHPAGVGGGSRLGRKLRVAPTRTTGRSPSAA